MRVLPREDLASERVACKSGVGLNVVVNKVGYINRVSLVGSVSSEEGVYRSLLR